MRFRGHPIGEAEGWHLACGRGGAAGGAFRGDDADEDELCGVQRAEEPRPMKIIGKKTTVSGQITKIRPKEAVPKGLLRPAGVDVWLRSKTKWDLQGNGCQLLLATLAALCLAILQGNILEYWQYLL